MTSRQRRRDEFSMQTLARRALEHSRQRGWELLDVPAQLRISTIDSFCRELALQQPLLSGLGGGIGIAEQPDELYRRAARQTLEKIDRKGTARRISCSAAQLKRCYCGATTTGRRWKTCLSRCSPNATAGCTTLFVWSDRAGLGGAARAAGAAVCTMPCAKR